MLADELLVLDGDSLSWQAARPLLDAALRLEQNDEPYSWYGWSKRQIGIFLESLPLQCSLVAGVWETMPGADGAEEQEHLRLGVVCEVVDGEICSLRTFEALVPAGLRSVERLKPGFEDALEIIHAVKAQVAPVAWALFTDKATWDEWLFAAGEANAIIDKGELLASFVRQGRCVILSGGGEPYLHSSRHHREI